MTRTLFAAFLLLAGPTFACVGDCNSDGEVTIDEMIAGVNLALGSTNACAAFDRNGNGEVSIDELLAAVNNATAGCVLEATPTPTVTPVPSPAETRCQVPDGEGVNYDPAQPFCELLSSYRFFTDGATQAPNDGVLPYDLNTPLFSDYARKHRFVWLPPGTTATYNNRDSFTFPIGTVIIKTFAFPRDERDPELGERLIETRLLARRAGGWEAITYLWNDEQTEARRRVIGARVAVSYPTEDGEFAINYQVPNTNQCKECHAEHNDVMAPIGPKARHLNKDHEYGDTLENQLTHWTAVGYLQGAPSDPDTAPRLAVFDDPDTGSVEDRARAYLDANCGHCHNPTGLARTSGLYLNIEEMEPARYGVCKPPVAAGQGSGGRRFDIVPGDPDGSILVYRMESTAPGIAMPELGRQTNHIEAVELMREWISAMEGSCD